MDIIKVGQLAWLRKWFPESIDGESVTIKLRRDTDGYWWNFSTLAFQSAEPTPAAMAFDAESVWKISFTPDRESTYSYWIVYVDVNDFGQMDAAGDPHVDAFVGANITTLARTKLFLGITDTLKDSLITMLISQVEADYLAIRNRTWDSVIEEEKVGVGDGTTKTFNLDNFPIILDRVDVYVNGDLETNVTIDYATGLITFTDAPAAYARITADYEIMGTYFPASSELTAIRMIGWQLQSSGSLGVKSESLGDHSISYANDSALRRGYPESVVGCIKRHASYS